MPIEITPEYLASQRLSPTFPKRFWAKVNKNGPIPAHCPELGPCWIWMAAKSDRNYGAVYGSENKNYIRAHIGAWILTFGAPDDQLVLHKCDVPSCVNPIHLFLGTAEDNVHDMDAKGRRIVPKGEGHHWSKLTSHEVLQIRKQWIEHPTDQESIAKQFGICASLVSMIVNRRRWAHV